jgi:hypothetical protein
VALDVVSLDEPWDGEPSPYPPSGSDGTENPSPSDHDQPPLPGIGTVPVPPCCDTLLRPLLPVVVWEVPAEPNP